MHGSQLSPPPQRRRQQRGPRRRRIQRAAPPQVVEDSFVPRPRRDPCSAQTRIALKNTILHGRLIDVAGLRARQDESAY